MQPVRYVHAVSGCHKLVQRFYWPENAIDWLRGLIICVMGHVRTHKLQMSGPTVHSYTVAPFT